jgi:uncharacterized protein
VNEVLLDTGPLISFLAADTRDHRWVMQQWKRVAAPMLTCEAVLIESAFLLKREKLDPDPIFALLEQGALRIGISIEEQGSDLRSLMRRYADRPMSLADACLVRMSEIYPSRRVFTLDSDFRFYKRFANRAIPLLMPD